MLSSQMLERFIAWWNRPPARDRVLEGLEGIDTPEKAIRGYDLRKRINMGAGIYSVLSSLRKEGLVAARYEYDQAVQMDVAYWWRTKRGGRDPVEEPPKGAVLVGAE